MVSPESAGMQLSVITGAWDDLPTLLTRLGYPFQILGSSLSIFQNNAALKSCQALYIACGAECDMTDIAAHHLRRFVENGGGLYVSDLAAPAIERLFPGQVTFSKLDYRSDNRVRVLDPALKAQLGDWISLHMDYQNSQGIQAVAPGVQVLIEGPRQDFDEQQYPYLVTFQYGKGQVIYTVFHNAHQVNDTEAQLLHYLVLRPLLTSAITQAHQALTTRAKAVHPADILEFISAAHPERPAESYTTWVGKPGSARVVLVWEGRASVAVKVTGPNGQRVKYHSSDQCPLVFDFTAPKAGEYACEVKAIQVSGPLLPYVLLLTRT